MKLHAVSFGVLFAIIFLTAQQLPTKQVEPSPPIPMPADRAADSYRIYSMLMPVGELGKQGWPHDLWLLADTTRTMVQPAQPCNLPSNQDLRVSNPMNPHVAVHPTPEQTKDFAELLEDFDHNCHVRVILTANSFNLTVPLHVLTEAEQTEFRGTRFGPNSRDKADPAVLAKYKGAPGLSSFSEVYFNAHHTVAMVYAEGWCGGLCANGFWAFFGLEDGQWKPLRWNATFMVS